LARRWEQRILRPTRPPEARSRPRRPGRPPRPRRPRSGPVRVRRRTRAPPRRASPLARRLWAFLHFNQESRCRGPAAPADGQKFGPRLERSQNGNRSLQMRQHTIPSTTATKCACFYVFGSSGPAVHEPRSEPDSRCDRPSLPVATGSAQRASNSAAYKLSEHPAAGIAKRTAKRIAPAARQSRLQVGRTPVSRPRGAYGPWHDDEQEPSGRRLSACACEIHGGACERCDSVDTCASRNSPSELVSGFAHAEEGELRCFSDA